MILCCAFIHIAPFPENLYLYKLYTKEEAQKSSSLLNLGLFSHFLDLRRILVFYVEILFKLITNYDNTKFNMTERRESKGIIPLQKTWQRHWMR